MVALDTWVEASDLYLARGSDVAGTRPVFTGDVFDGVAIPGVQESGLAIVVSHPCSIRGPHGAIQDRVTMATVGEHGPVSPSQFSSGFYDRMPLPELKDDALCVGWIGALGTVDGAGLPSGDRIACLSSLGVNILQQRLVWQLTRVEVPTWKFEEAFAHTWHEAALLEEWSDSAVEAGEALPSAVAAFDDFIRLPVDPSDVASESLQGWLRDPQRRPTVRTRLREEAAARF